MKFNNELHEALLYMFIGEFMGWTAYEGVTYPFTLEGSLSARILPLFPMENAAVEYEGFISDRTIELLLNEPKNHMFQCGQLHFLPTITQKNRIKFHFEEN